MLFKQKRAIYECRVTEKSSEQGVTIPTTSYYNSIDKSVLEMLVLAQWVPVSKVGEITEDHLKTCVEARAKIKPEDYDLAQVEKGIKEIRMDSSLRSLEFQIWNLGLKYNQKLESLGYSKFIETHPKLAVSHIMQRITNVQLRKRMKLSLRLHKRTGLRRIISFSCAKLHHHSDIYIDLGEDDPEDLTNGLTERVKDARKNGMSESGCKKLGNLLDKYKAVFK